jgi:hypothetical protein
MLIVVKLPRLRHAIRLYHMFYFCKYYVGSRWKCNDIQWNKFKLVTSTCSTRIEHVSHSGQLAPGCRTRPDAAPSPSPRIRGIRSHRRRPPHAAPFPVPRRLRFCAYIGLAHACSISCTQESTRPPMDACQRCIMMTHGAPVAGGSHCNMCNTRFTFATSR